MCADLDVDGAKETVRQIEAGGRRRRPLRRRRGRGGRGGCGHRRGHASTSAASTSSSTTSASPRPASAQSLEDHTAEDFERLFAVNVGGVFHGCKHAVITLQGAGWWRGDPQHRIGRRARRLGRHRLRRHQGRGAPAHRGVAIEAAPFGVRVNAICPAGMPYTGFMAAGGLEVEDDVRQQVAESVGASHPLGRPITAEDCAEAAVLPRVGPRRERHRRAVPGRRRLRRAMTDPSTGLPTLDRERIRELFDLRSSVERRSPVATYTDDPNPVWHRLRDEGPVLPGHRARAPRVRGRRLLPRSALARAAPLLGVQLRGRATPPTATRTCSPRRRRRPTAWARP